MLKSIPEVAMDFLERWLGLAPDGGSGAVELALLMACASAALTAALWRRRLARPVPRGGDRLSLR